MSLNIAKPHVSAVLLQHTHPYTLIVYISSIYDHKFLTVSYKPHFNSHLHLIRMCAPALFLVFHLTFPLILTRPGVATYNSATTASTLNNRPMKSTVSLSSTHLFLLFLSSAAPFVARQCETNETCNIHVPFVQPKTAHVNQHCGSLTLMPTLFVRDTVSTHASHVWSFSSPLLIF